MFEVLLRPSYRSLISICLKFTTVALKEMCEYLYSFGTLMFTKSPKLTHNAKFPVDIRLHSFSIFIKRQQNSPLGNIIFIQQRKCCFESAIYLGRWGVGLGDLETRHEICERKVHTGENNEKQSLFLIFSSPAGRTWHKHMRIWDAAIVNTGTGHRRPYHGVLSRFMKDSSHVRVS